MRLIASIFALIFAASSALAEPPPLPLPWVKLSEIWYTPTQVRLYGANNGQDCAVNPCNAVYVQTHLPPGGDYGPQATICADPPTCNTWTSPPYEVDLGPFGLPEDAKVAIMNGLLVITHGTTIETADIHVTFHAAGQPINCAKYMGQSVETAVGGGQRSNIGVWVPLTARKFQFCYYLNTPGAWPTNSSYAINLSIQAWGR